VCFFLAVLPNMSSFRIGTTLFVAGHVVVAKKRMTIIIIDELGQSVVDRPIGRRVLERHPARHAFGRDLVETIPARRVAARDLGVMIMMMIYVLS
jgi:hypothetical protein